MEQVRKEKQLQQQERPQARLYCPRCGSADTKFRYFNNQNLAQPRYLCKTCKRLWTEGGSLREVPLGGKKTTPAEFSSLEYGDSSSHFEQPPIPTMEELQGSYYMSTMTSLVPQIFDVPSIEPVTNFQQTIDPVESLYFNNELSDLHTINSQLQPEATHQTANVWNQANGDTAGMSFLPSWNIQSYTSEQASTQQNPYYQDPSIIADPGMVSLNQVHVPADSYYHSSNYDMVQPTWPMNFTPQYQPLNLPGSFSTSDVELASLPESFSAPDVGLPSLPGTFPTSDGGLSSLLGSFSTSDVGLWDNSSGNATNMGLPTTSMNPNQWPDFPGFSPP